MTFIHWILAAGYPACVGLGYWLHYRFGAQVAADVQKIKQLKP